MTRVPPSQKPVVDRMTALGLLTTCPRKKGALSSVFRSYEKLDIIEKCDSEAPPYVQPGATHYGGSDSYSRDSAFVESPSAVTKITLSIWGQFAPENFDVSPVIINGTDVTTTNCGFQLRADGGNKEFAGTFLVGGETEFDFTHFIPNGIADGEFHNIIATVDLLEKTHQVYVDDSVALVNSSLTGGQALTLDTSVFTLWRTGVAQFQGCLAEVFLHFDGLDLSIEANRRKFISADKKPVGLGAHGELPFGIAPIFYSPRGDGTNVGTGGDLTPVGTPTECDSHP